LSPGLQGLADVCGALSRAEAGPTWPGPGCCGPCMRRNEAARAATQAQSTEAAAAKGMVREMLHQTTPSRIGCYIPWDVRKGRVRVETKGWGEAECSVAEQRSGDT
jgi:hypothetical protein